jgi:hypothetical protein
LHRGDGYTHSDANGNGYSNGNGHTDRYTDPERYAYAYANSNPNPHAYTNCYSGAYAICHCATASDCQTFLNDAKRNFP